MTCIGVLGGMGPAATVDFMSKLVELTPASCDQEHLPVVVANLPQVPDRSAAILGRGADPLPGLRRSVEILNEAGAGVIAIPCNSSHHWYRELCELSLAPIIHIVHACIERIPAGARRTMVLATRGTLASGFYQRELEAHGQHCVAPDPVRDQPFVDDCIRRVKAGDRAGAAASLQVMLDHAKAEGADVVILGCTELPLAAAAGTDAHGMLLIDSSLELARAVVEYGLRSGWNHG
ncbi:aspartate/glutamate racemase family protein [Derxia gummosa]|uniref:Aspartate/glutamate racemase family protein n=1 Tax=Derxia gummosa DSM 723 TaxID=1121388 RepID=A0A8B6X4F7_9BURK|nr:amino acid racemase [Derxia gummosa]